MNLVFQIVADADDMLIFLHLYCCCSDDWSRKAALEVSTCLMMMSSNVLRWMALARMSVWSD